MDKIRITETVIATIIAIKLDQLLTYTKYKISDYWEQYCKNKYFREERQKLITTYPGYFGTSGKEKPELANLNTLEDNNLILFHGKHNPPVVLQHIDYRKGNYYLIDKDKKMDIDLVADLGESDALDIIPSCSINKIIIYYCDCHIKSIFSNVLNIVNRLLKENGEIYLITPTNLAEIEDQLLAHKLTLLKNLSTSLTLPGFGSIQYVSNNRIYSGTLACHLDTTSHYFYNTISERNVYVYQRNKSNEADVRMQDYISNLTTKDNIGR